jgi:uncharacterized protein (TIGR03086 family)
VTSSAGSALAGAVELLDRSLAYTRVVLADVRPGSLGWPTPCAGWTLGQLLAHMEDALDAFTEAASGQVEVEPVPETSSRVDALREKACALLGAWTAARSVSDQVGVRDLALDAPLLVATAALEITVHGWDVGQATGRRTRIPDDLALALLPLAQQVIGPADRGARFASPRCTTAGAAPDVRLLSWTGRDEGHMTEPLQGNSGEPTMRRGRAS